MSGLVAVRNLRRRGDTGPKALIDPLQVAEIYTGGVRTPDVMEFILSDRFLNQPGIYPRQATILKSIFLQDSLFTQYDYDVIGSWGESFARTGDHGCQPDLLERIRICQEQGRPWFREIIGVIGRRGSKGFLGALSGAYVLWHYMHKPGGPQAFYGIERSKKLVGIVFAGKKSQAKENQWRDLVSVISGGPCFSPYISRQLGEIMTVYAPSDILRAQEQALRGVISDADQATFELVPRESSLMAARGPTSFCLDPSTPVLTAELRWVPIGSLQAGDRVVGIDEHPESKGAQRKLRDAEVVATRRTRKAALRLTFEDGSSVVCSADHQWLVRDMGKGGATHWRTAGRMKPGNHIKHLVDPWEEEQAWGAGYLAGILDGEGSVSGYHGRAGRDVFFAQNPGPVLDQTMKLLAERGFQMVPANHHAYSQGEAKCQQWATRGAAESMRLLGQIRPLRLFQKQRSVWEGVAPRGGLTPSGRVRPDAYKTIVSIEHLPEQDLVDIQTTTRTFIANGLVSHNCQFYDEMAHVVATGINRSAGEVYGAATPSLDQFHNDAFIYAGSSPWQMTGRYYEMWEEAIAKEPDGSPSYPEKFMVQLESWDPYADYDKAEQIIVRPPQRFVVYIEQEVSAYETVKVPVEVEEPAQTFEHKNNAIQLYDSNMQQLEKSNPDNFAVERRSKWAAIIDGYLDEKKVAEVFGPWQGDLLRVRPQGILSVKYMAHGDPGLVNDRFGYALGHLESVETSRTLPDGTVKVESVNHVVFDVLHTWDPADFEEHRIDYTVPEDEICQYIDAFMPDEQTFDQFNCLSGDTLITTRYGIQRLADVVDPDRRMMVGETIAVEGLWVQTPQGQFPVGEAHHRGLAPTRIFMTKPGYCIEATPEHRVWVRPAKAKAWHPESEPRWMRAQDVKTGDWVQVRKNHDLPDQEVDVSHLQPRRNSKSGIWGVYEKKGLWGAYGRDDGRRVSLGSYTTKDEAAEVAHSWRQDHPKAARKGTRYPVTCNPQLAEVLGLLISEGDSSADAVRFGNSDRDLLQHYADSMATLFGGDWIYSYDGQRKGDRWYPYGHVRVGGQIAEFISSLGISGLSQGKSTPSIIFESPREVIAAYLRGLFEGDGGMTAVRPNDQYLALVTTSQDIAEQTHHLLLAIGIYSTLWSGHYAYKGERRRQWRVKIFGLDILEYARLVGFISPRKQGELRALVSAIEARGNKAGLRSKNNRDGDLQWFRVTAIMDSTADCYDISVPGPECFVANGIVCHNSASSISKIRKHVVEGSRPKKTQVYEVTATEATNFVKAEVFKSGINTNRIHAPMLDVHGAPNDASVVAELEMRFLQRKGNRVDHPSSGPVQSKDVFDCLCEVVWRLIGKELAEEMGMELAALGIGTGGQGGTNPYGAMTSHSAGRNDVTNLANQFSQASGGGPVGGTNPARGAGGRSAW
jgi:intein/homing endonuclease